MTSSGPAEHDTISRAIGASGLTITEIADRAGLNPTQLHHFPLNRVPLAVLGRLARVLDLPIGLLLNHWDHELDQASDSSTIGAYLADFRHGLTRDDLAEALDWTLLRVERALPHLDTTLHHSGMCLALNADRIIIVGRLKRTDLRTRHSLERLTASDPDPKLATIVWNALAGFAAETTNNIESLETASRLGLTYERHGRIPRHRLRALLAGPDKQPPLTPPDHTDTILAPLLTQLLRKH